MSKDLEEQRKELLPLLKEIEETCEKLEEIKGFDLGEKLFDEMITHSSSGSEYTLLDNLTDFVGMMWVWAGIMKVSYNARYNIDILPLVLKLCTSLKTWCELPPEEREAFLLKELCKAHMVFPLLMEQVGIDVTKKAFSVVSSFPFSQAKDPSAN